MPLGEAGHPAGAFGGMLCPSGPPRLCPFDHQHAQLSSESLCSEPHQLRVGWVRDQGHICSNCSAVQRAPAKPRRSNGAMCTGPGNVNNDRHAQVGASYAQNCMAHSQHLLSEGLFMPIVQRRN